MRNPRKKFAKIYDKYIEKIYRFIFLKVNSPEIAEDLSSETFLRGWKAFQNPKKIKNPQAFLYKIARNLVIDHYREKGKAQIISAEYASIIDPCQDLAEKAMLTSDVNSIRQALVNVKPDYQDIIIWRYLDEMSISEIAQALDRTDGATRVLLHRAMKALRTTMAGGEEN